MSIAAGKQEMVPLKKVGARCNAGHAAGVNLSTCLCIHAEENALLEAGRERIRGGSILYCDTYGTFPLFAEQSYKSIIVVLA